MTLVSVWKKDKSKRDRFASARERCDRNWPYHRERVKAAFLELSSIDSRFSAHDRDEMTKLRADGDPIYHGYDYVILSEDDRVTPRRTIYSNGKSFHIDHEREEGGSITVHYTYGQALIQVFLKPPKSNKSIIEKTDILVWVGRNTDALTTAFCERLIGKYLILARAESNFETSTILERFRIRWWRFMDMRNRLQIYDTHINLLNRWELPVAAAILALASFAISLLKLRC
ncbi:hypothetical protein [Pseudomonas sp.]|uniref:hypothetical protein n=1 Tax=Pseudomonas sp. TaxID=306 RepID=UPI003CC5638A